MQEVLAFLKSVLAAIIAFFMAIYGFFCGLFKCCKPDETTTTTAIVSESDIDVSSTDPTDIPDSTEPSTESTTESTTDGTSSGTTEPTPFEPTTLKDPAVSASLSSFGGSEFEKFTGSSARSGYFCACGQTRSKDGKFSGLISGKFSSPYSFITKYDTTGTEVFTIPVYNASYPVYLTDVTIMRNGNIVACGYIEKGAKSTAFFDVYDPDGALILHKEATCSGSCFYNAVSTTSDGFVIGGQTGSNTGDFEGLPDYTCGVIIRFSANGDVLWKRYLGGTRGADVTDLDTDTNNNTYVTVSTSSVDGEMASFSGLIENSLDNVVIKYNYAGEMQWYGVIASNASDSFNSVAADSNNGGCIVGGSYTIFSTDKPGGTLSDLTVAGGTDSVLIRFDTNGKIKWKRSVSGIGDDYITDVVKLDGGYAAVGRTTSANREFYENHGGYDGFVDIVSTTGKQIACRNLGGTERDDIGSAAFNSGNLMVFGQSLSTDCYFEGQNSHITEASYDSNLYDCFAARYAIDLT